MSEQQYMNNDERLGPSVKFTIPEMIQIYKDNQWCDGMETDQDIIDDILSHDVVAIEEREQYRYDGSTGKLYELSHSHGCYLFACSNPFRLSESDLIEEYENRSQNV